MNMNNGKKGKDRRKKMVNYQTNGPTTSVRKQDKKNKNSLELFKMKIFIFVMMKQIIQAQFFFWIKW